MLKLRPNARQRPPRKPRRKLPSRRRGRVRLRPWQRNQRLPYLPRVLESRPQGNPFPLGLRLPRNPLWFLRPENLLRQLAIRLSQRLQSLARLRLPEFRGTRPLLRHRVALRQLALRALRFRRARGTARRYSDIALPAACRCPSRRGKTHACAPRPANARAARNKAHAAGATASAAAYQSRAWQAHLCAKACAARAASGG